MEIICILIWTLMIPLKVGKIRDNVADNDWMDQSGDWCFVFVAVSQDRSWRQYAYIFHRPFLQLSPGACNLRFKGSFASPAQKENRKSMFKSAVLAAKVYSYSLRFFDLSTPYLRTIRRPLILVLSLYLSLFNYISRQNHGSLDTPQGILLLSKHL